ncbi:MULTISPECIES: glutamine synthetase III [unclassified Siphonobacter]|uniref:glutamine synthetase III family protein n=1 Tax=unclassified Siphonobacter TaxID=2635712 RepID=UPI000CB64B6A|nr:MULTISPECIES: glutamine synthetase III [unclassified Siphonobacter]MDQ1088945.1 glutamine synthetase [Siphonobacter sp. SORGH_AS_1065]MDR6195126.1 glutamine synthetase [Siphonobacter sp. SORGH_AS_0500]PKK38354.1 glutamine synthetase type III [Siphonobacter sp. SORGH_AS_0500]
MALARFKALSLAQSRQLPTVKVPSEKVTEYFGSLTFNEEAMRSLLSPETFQRITKSIKEGHKIDRDTADEVAAAMKSWALSKGASHYTHWFQPLTGTTAEKHDAFFDIVPGTGKAIEKFKGSALVQQEPDASSFPNGGIRSTFEARGYSAWDSSSPAFILENSAGTSTLCIPSVFVAYTGEALDYKTPLLKSIELIDKAATKVMSEYFDRNTEKTIPTLGAEQEYFLVDEALFNARPDLLMAGRTVFGHSPAKGQQLEDHYFGSIPPRVNAFMVDFEVEAQRLGIPVRTRHNEVAPAQFEVAPTFEEVNLACDHNALLMDLMQKIASRHKFKVLFHEKPFAGINGSGKHNNWSLATDTGINVLGPSTKPKESLRFVSFLVCVVKAVHDHADLLRATIATAGNEHRLGANEAPPAIMSVFLGSELSRVIDTIENMPLMTEFKLEKGDNVYLKLGINKVPSLLLDNTDRNRTSPFAFTGNKFEFRAVGSSANSASAMTILNTIVADQLIQFRKDVDELINTDLKKELAIVEVLKKYITSSKRIIFEGNGYSDDWVVEAERRGLSNIRSAPEALAVYTRKEVVDLFEKYGIFTEKELHARYEIELENYIKKIQIESRVIGDLAINHIISTALKYQTKLVENVKGQKDIGIEEKYYAPTVETIKRIAEHTAQIQILVDEMTEARKKANAITDSEEQARLYGTEVKDYFEKIRYNVDKLELIVDDDEWPLVKYRELLMLR